MLGNPIVGTVCLSAAIKCMQSVLITTQEIYGFVSTIKETTYHVNVVNLLGELDTEHNIGLIEVMLHEIDVNNHYTQTLGFALKSIEDNLKGIHTLLNEVKQRVEYNNGLWVNMYGYRTKKFDDLSEKLKFLSNSLKGRKDDLFNILKINHSLVKAENYKEIYHEYTDDTLNVSILSVQKLEENNDDLKTIEEHPIEEHPIEEHQPKDPSKV
jgi:hypothetical protein